MMHKSLKQVYIWYFSRNLETNLHEKVTENDKRTGHMVSRSVGRPERVEAPLYRQVELSWGGGAQGE